MSPRSKGLVAVFAIIVGFLVFNWWFLDGSTTRPRVVRSRLTLVAETPEGERTGSGVSQLTIRFAGGLTKAQGWAFTRQLVGEAVVVDLGPRGLLFATLRRREELTFDGAGGSSVGYNAGLTLFPREKFRGDIGTGPAAKDEMAAYLDELNRVKPKAQLPIDKIPVLVRFADPNDPQSVALVDPQALFTSFGPGVTLKGAFVEITDDPVSLGIESRLPWLKSSKYSDPLFPNPHHQVDPERRRVRLLTYDDFRRPFR